MASSYSRRCRYCSRWISMRQMPAGQWVAFEGDSVHDCGRPPPQRVTTSRSRRDAPTPAASGEFEDFEIPSRPGSSTLQTSEPFRRPGVPKTKPTPVIRNVLAKPAPSTTEHEEFEDFQMPASATSVNINARAPSATHKNARV